MLTPFFVSRGICIRHPRNGKGKRASLHRRLPLLGLVFSLTILGFSFGAPPGHPSGHNSQGPAPPDLSDMVFWVSAEWGVIARWRVSRGDDPRYAHHEYDDSNWTLFGSKTTAHLCDAPGYLWYRASIPPQPTWAGQGVILRTGWVADSAQIYLNGHLIADNLSSQYMAKNLTDFAMTFPYRSRTPKTLLDISHTFDITDLIRPAEINLLAVRLYTNTTSGGLGMMGIGLKQRPAETSGVPLEAGLRVLLLGDSITDQSSVIESYPHKLWDFFSAFLPEKNITIINFGRDAETTGRALARVPEVVSQRPDLVLINLGVNDVWWAGTNLSVYRSNMETLVKSFQNLSGAVVVLSTAVPILVDHGGVPLPTYPCADATFFQAQEAYNHAIYSLAEERGLGVVPIDQAFLSVLNQTAFPETRRAGYLLQRDGVHPNGRGAALVAIAILERAFSVPPGYIGYLGEAWDYEREASEDGEAPATEVTEPSDGQGWKTEPLRLILQASDPRPGSGVAATFYRIDGGTTKRYQGPTAALEGWHSYTYFSVDNAGNVEEAKVLGLGLDTIPPKIDLIQVEGDVGPDQPVAIRARVQDARGLLEVACIYRRDGDDLVKLSMPPAGDDLYECILPGSPDWTRVDFHVWAVDESGYESRTGQHSYAVADPVCPPLACIFLPILMVRHPFGRSLA